MEPESESSLNDVNESKESFKDNLAILEREFEIATQRLDAQKQTLQEFAKEGQKLLRITLVFVGLLLTAVSVSPNQAFQTLGSDQVAISLQGLQVDNLHLTIVVAGSLALSALSHLIGNEARATRNYGETKDFEELFNDPNRSEAEYLRGRICSYKHRIEQNNGVISAIESILTLGKTFLTVSIVGLTILSLSIAIGPISTETVALLLIGSAILLIRQARKFPDGYIRRDSPDSKLNQLFLTGDSDQEDTSE